MAKLTDTIRGVLARYAADPVVGTRCSGHGALTAHGAAGVVNTCPNRNVHLIRTVRVRRVRRHQDVIVIKTAGQGLEVQVDVVVVTTAVIVIAIVVRVGVSTALAGRLAATRPDDKITRAPHLGALCVRPAWRLDEPERLVPADVTRALA